MEVDEQPVNPPKATEEKNDEIKNNEESENVSVEKASADDQNNASVPSDETKMEEQKEEEEKEVEEGWVTHLRCVAKVLSGERTVSLNQEFLIRNNHTDLQILKNTKEAGRNSITHNATIIANGFMHYGTTSDVFLRENLDWLKRASNWGKFTATASLGIIHYGHEKEALNLMSSYLPKDSSSGSPYAEGGGLFALGLIHANHGSNIIDYLSKEVRVNQNEVIRHGGCLGLGLAAMGTADPDVYQLLADNLRQDDAVIGEGAGVAMGLVMLGTRAPLAINEMIEYAQETQHEKIQRGLALGIAMLFYGHLEEADTAIEQLCTHKDPLLRRAGMFTISMAYCGSGDNCAIKRLLHVAVSDVDSDVRRSAVAGIGFILFRNPDQCVSVVSLLAESFNPHVRCGAAWALGIACAASGNKEALAILEPMFSDTIPFVQQGALVASAMIIIQHNECMVKNSRVMEIRKIYAKIISDRLEDSITKFGAILAQGIVDAGGRNVTLSLQSRTGHTQMQTVVGMLVFTQFWFWFPYCHFLSLAFSPTALIGLNGQLQMPKLQFKSNARPSQYGYVPHLEKEKEKERGKVATVVLSVAAKKSKSKLGGSTSKSTGGNDENVDSNEPVTVEPMETESTVTLNDKDTENDVVFDESKISAEDKKPSSLKEDKKSSGPLYETLHNPARVLPQQVFYHSRY
jgi:26S proteasome regulatory subunit N2